MAADPKKAGKRGVAPIEVQVVQTESANTVAEPVKLAFRLTDRDTGQPVINLPDVNILVFSPAWQSRFEVAGESDGIYALETEIPEPGTYSVSLSIPSQGMDGTRYLWLTVHPAQ